MFGSKTGKIQKAIEKKNPKALLRLINDKDASVSLQAIEAMGKVKCDDTYNTLISLLRSPKAEVRAAAVAALGTQADPKAQAHISHMEKTEKDPVVLEAMKEALGKLHSKE